jgi:uncharacterized membrane protein YdbT with pleckstrin-like domain
MPRTIPLSVLLRFLAVTGGIGAAVVAWGLLQGDYGPDVAFNWRGLRTLIVLALAYLVAFPILGFVAWRSRNGRRWVAAYAGTVIGAALASAVAMVLGALSREDVAANLDVGAVLQVAVVSVLVAGAVAGIAFVVVAGILDVATMSRKARPGGPGTP